MNNRLLFSGLLCAFLASILPACTASGPANTDLGGGGGGGTSTGTVTGTWTGTDACTRCWPPCYTDLLQQCIPHGMCSGENLSSHDGSACYENGVKIRVSVSDAEYYKSDGHLCFHSTWGDDHGVWTTTLTGEFGDVITDRDPDDGTHAVTCGGQTYIVDSTSADCAACTLTAQPILICTTGGCTLP